MANTSVATLLLLVLILSVALSADADADTRKPYIIHMLKSMKPPHFNLHHHWYASMLHQVSQSDSPSDLLYTYDTLLHGFAARLTTAEAEAMESMDGCLAVIPSSRNKIATTHSPEFLGLTSSSSSSPGLWSQYSTHGEDIIIGMIDTGIWPESQSFSEEGLGPVPARWKGICESGQEFNSSNCNRKIIGARYFFKGYELNETRINQTLEYKSPRDSDGHGTHTASTVAGAAVAGTSFFGFANGTARGMAPRARLAIYKVCWQEGCEDIDTAAAMEQAVADGVDIISMSIGSSDAQFPMDPTAVAAFGAMEMGVFVSAAAGNDGPFVSTLSNAAPWFTTVGASTTDRYFPASVVLGNQEIYRGTSNYKGKYAQLQTSLPLVYASASNSSRRCLSGSLDPKLVKGKIVVCDQLVISKNDGETDALTKGIEVAEAGGAGMIVANEKFYGADEQITNVNILPAISVSYWAGEKIKSYMKGNGVNGTATMGFSGLTVLGSAAAAPIVASFSSRGPSSAYPHILKPDMIAPGVNILAAYNPGLPYFLISGTSMACPHVSGIATLIKAIHPKWSPAAIKSALMTSSYIVNNKKQAIRDSATLEAADPFAMGAGHVDPRAAVNPGLVYDMAAQDYVNFVCSLNYTKQQIALLTKSTLIACPNSSLEAGDLNYPSFSFNSGINKSVQVKRTVTNVGIEGDAVYRVSVKSPPGVKISVQPETLEFKNLQDKASYSVRFESYITSPSPSPSPSSSPVFGEIRWTCIKGGTHVVRSPVAVATMA